MLLAVALSALSFQPRVGCAAYAGPVARAPARAAYAAPVTLAPVRAEIRMADDGDDGDDLAAEFASLDAELLKMPRLTTPERENYRAWRERRKAQAGGETPEEAPPLPLGMDPNESVDGTLADLTGMYGDDGDPIEASDRQKAAADAYAKRMLGDDDGGGGDNAVDKLLGK